jgi:tellurite resistance protein TehA-like permease
MLTTEAVVRIHAVLCPAFVAGLLNVHRGWSVAVEAIIFLLDDSRGRARMYIYICIYIYIFIYLFLNRERGLSDRAMIGAELAPGHHSSGAGLLMVLLNSEERKELAIEAVSFAFGGLHVI